MFSLQIVDSDAFLDMPASSQLLYFHLSMRADDDGFVGNPKRIMRTVGASDDDFKVLLAKRFLLTFESGVVVIKHWRIHNLIRHDRYTETKYVEEKSALTIKENGSYTELHTIRQPDGNQLATQVRLGKDRLSSAAGASRGFNPLGSEIIKALEEVDPKNKTYYGNTTQRAACDFLIDQYGLEEVIKRIAVLPKTNKLSYFPNITTPVQLKEKWVQLEDAVQRKRSETEAKKVKVI